MRWRRSTTIPADVVRAAGLEPDERALAGAQDADGHWLVGTDRALHRQGGPQGGSGGGPQGGDGWIVHRWEDLDRATWDREEGVLTVVEVADFGQPEPRRDHRIERPGRLLELVRERITASILTRRPVPVRRGAGITVVVRRSPTRRGEATFSFVLDPGLDPADEEVRAAVRRGVAEVRDEVRDELGG